MAIYYILYIIIGTLPILFLDKKKGEREKKNKFFSWICFSFIFLLLALRHQSMGVDLAYQKDTGYLAAFDTLSSYSWKKIFEIESFLNYEKGYVIFNKLVGSIWADRQFFLAVCAFVSLFPVALVVYKKSLDSIFSYFIYMALPSFFIVYSGLRQGIALGLCFLSVLFIEDKKPIKFIITVLLGVTFHKSAMVFLLAYPIYYIKLNDTGRFFTFLFLPIIFIFREPLFLILSRFFKDEVVLEDTGAITLLIAFVLIYFFCVFYAKKSSQTNGYLNLFYVACACQVFGNIYATAMRIGYYFMIILILLLPKIVDEIRDTDTKVIFKTLIIIGFIVFGLYSIYSSGTSWARAYPYNWFWTVIP